MSLSERLRQAALERAQMSGQRVDDYVLEPSGVIDLREFERESAPAVDSAVTLPPLERAADIDDLYGKPLATSRLWKRVRAGAVGNSSPPATAPATTSAPTGEAVVTEAIFIDLTEDVPLFDLDNAPRQTTSVETPCPHCATPTERIRIDLFGATDHFTCADCGHVWQRRRS